MLLIHANELMNINEHGVTGSDSLNFIALFGEGAARRLRRGQAGAPRGPSAGRFSLTLAVSAPADVYVARSNPGSNWLLIRRTGCL